MVKGQAAVRFSQDGRSVTKADLGQSNFLTINRNSRSPKPHTGMRQKGSVCRGKGCEKGQ